MESVAQLSILGMGEWRDIVSTHYKVLKCEYAITVHTTLHRVPVWIEKEFLSERIAFSLPSC